MNSPLFLTILDVLQYFFLVYFTILIGIYFLLIAFGSLKVYARHREVEEDFTSIFHPEYLPEISFLMPIFKEEKTVEQTIDDVLNLRYPHKKLLIINDGSSQDIINYLIERYDMIEVPYLCIEKLPCQHIRAIYRSRRCPELFLIDKQHGGKFDGINAAINVCTSPYFIVFDSDTFIDDKGFEALIRPLFSDPKTIAVGASVRISNECEHKQHEISTINYPATYLISMQSIEYLRAFLTRSGWDLFNGNFIVSGAFAVFPRDLIVEVGGFANSVGEDVEIILRLHHIMLQSKQKYKIFYLPDPIAWTMAPETWADLSRQRIRWQRGLFEGLWFHKQMFFNPRYGMKGLFIYPYWVFGEALEPFVEVLGYIYIIISWLVGALYFPFLIYYLILSFGIILLITFYSLLVEEMSFRRYPSVKTLVLLFTSCLVENIGYHQCSLYWRIRGAFSFLWNFRKINKEARRVKESMI